jgi:hypothetical protein
MTINGGHFVVSVGTGYSKGQTYLKAGETITMTVYSSSWDIKENFNNKVVLYVDDDNSDLNPNTFTGNYDESDEANNSLEQFVQVGKLSRNRITGIEGFKSEVFPEERLKIKIKVLTRIDEIASQDKGYNPILSPYKYGLTGSFPLHQDLRGVFDGEFWIFDFAAPKEAGSYFLAFSLFCQAGENHCSKDSSITGTLQNYFDFEIISNSQDQTTDPDVKAGQASGNAQEDYAAKASLAFNGNFDSILEEIRQLRDEIKEKESENKYLKKLLKEYEKVTENMQEAISLFLAYGIDENTKKLGEGERAAVLYSYESVFDKLPETEPELTDLIKIANGRYPGTTNGSAEKKAKNQFVSIYGRVPDMDNPKDKAAVVVMAYGIRQSAANRNLDSEKAGLKIFRSIFKKAPASTEEWNNLQAITYSGATRSADTDKDLASDEIEKKLGTDPVNPDTDGDGFKDGDEILNGYNPKGAGKS